MVAVLASACASPVHAQGPPRGGQPGGAEALGVYPENATRVTAIVRRVSGDTLTLEILDARPAQPDRPMGPAVGTLEAVARERVDTALAGSRIEATVSLVGDTRASRWLVFDIRPLP